MTLHPRSHGALAAALLAFFATRAAAQAVPPVPSPAPTPPGRAQRAAFLEMFARSYFPGRSGQVMVVPREGEILTATNPALQFMHGSPWSYDTRIPMIFWGPRYVRAGRYTEPAAQQDI